MKILLFGGSGQVGQEVRKRGRDLHFEIISPVTSELNITDREQVIFLAEKVKPDAIINCAAYTAVDAAEEDRATAFDVNENGARYVAEAAKVANSRLVYISTDYVFSGERNQPFREDDPVSPLNVYGASKLAGEKTVLEILPENSLIMRTSSVHGRYGQNIVHTILALLEQRDVLQFVDDQIMSPTWAGWLAETLLDLLRLDARGILHASCSGEVSWCGFAKAVLQHAQKKLPDADNKRIVPVTALEFPRPAKRPAYSVLDTTKLERILGRPPITWQEGLRNHMKDLGYE